MLVNRHLEIKSVLHVNILIIKERLKVFNVYIFYKKNFVKTKQVLTFAAVKRDYKKNFRPLCLLDLLEYTQNFPAGKKMISG